MKHETDVVNLLIETTISISPAEMKKKKHYIVAKISIFSSSTPNIYIFPLLSIAFRLKKKQIKIIRKRLDKIRIPSFHITKSMHLG